MTIKERVQSIIDDVIIDNIGLTINDEKFVESLAEKLEQLVNDGTIEHWSVSGGDQLSVFITENDKQYLLGEWNPDGGRKDA